MRINNVRRLHNGVYKNMAERRVVITGLGLTTCIGTGKDAYFDALKDGAIGIDTISRFDASHFPSSIGGEVRDIKTRDYVPKAHRKATKLMCRDIELTVIAADLAVRDAKLTTKGTDPASPSSLDPIRSGVNIGAGLICCDIEELGGAVTDGVTDNKFDYGKWGTDGMLSLTPLWLLKYLPNMLNCHISIIHDLQGPSNAITCADAGGLLSISEAAKLIARDKADVMICGGAESKINPIDLLRQVFFKYTNNNSNDDPQSACKPFDEHADGTAIAEGGGIIILESLEHALARDAHIYGEVTGYGSSTCFTDDFITPETNGDGIAIALKQAIDKAGISPADIGLLIPQGVGVRQMDIAEANAINTVFGASTKSLPIYSTKPQIGFAGTAGCSIDLITAVLILNNGIIPKTQNTQNVNENYGINVTCDGPIKTEMQHVATNCHAIGGQTAAMVVSRYKT
jgi:3-oxoacyl-[acyl-carrier-protein] synthase II